MGNQQGKEDIIIKCEISHMVKQFFKDSVIAWYAPNVNSPENFPIIAQLERFCPVRTFTEPEEASAFLKNETKAVCHVLATSEVHLKEFIADIGENQNVYGIYIVCKNQENWLSANAKIRCVEKNIQSVLFKIEQSLVKGTEEKVSFGFSYAPIFNEIDQCKLTLRHLYLKTIPNFKNLAQAKNDLLTLCKILYVDDKSFDFIIDLTENYDEKNILTWFTQQSLFSKVINRCLAISSSDSLQYCRLPIHDMQKAIHDQYLKKNKHSGGFLFRSVYLGDEEWTFLKENLNKEIETLGFFSTYKNLNTALNFMQTNPSQKVLISIVIPRGANVEEYGFAEMEQDPNHVLFNLMSRFTILEANEKYSEELPYRHLVLLYGAHGFRKYLAEQNPVQTALLENNEEILCDSCKGHVLEKSPRFFFKSFINHQNHYCFACLRNIPAPINTTFLCVPVSHPEDKTTMTTKGCLLTYPANIRIPFYGYECHKCHQENNPTTVYLKCTECQEKWCENCLENSENCLQSGHSIILERNPFSFWQEKMSDNELKAEKDQMFFYNQEHQQAAIFEKTKEYQKLLDYYLKLLDEKHSLPDQCLIELGIGQAYLLKGEYYEAQEYLSKALKTSQVGHLDQRPILERLGQLYYRLGEYTKAEEYCIKTLEASEASQNQDRNLKIAASYNNLAMIYIDQALFSKGIEYSLKAIDLFEEHYGDSHPYFGLYCANLGRAYYLQGEYQKALVEFNKVAGIAKSVPGDAEQLKVYYDNKGKIAEIKGDYKKALEYYLKALEIYKEFCGDELFYLTYHYTTLGRIYQKLGEYKKALEYFVKTEEILPVSNLNNRAHLGESSCDIGSAYNYLGEDEKAMEYYDRALQIAEAVFGEKEHSNYADCYSGLGRVFCSKEEYQTALDYHLQSLEIRKGVYGERHPDVAACYVDMGDVYKAEGDGKKAGESYIKALEIRKLVFGDGHPETISVEKEIAKLKESHEV